MEDNTRPAVSPDRVMATLTAYQRSAALTGALDLGLFSALGEAGPATADAMAARCAASSRGMRILCDYLTVDGFLAKEGDTYSLTPESAAFLDRRSPAYLGGAARFLSSPALMEAFRDVAGAVRRGGTMMAGGTVSADNSVWVDFARGMMPMLAPLAEQLATLVPVPADRKVTVLDIAAGHGAFGIAFARRHPSVEVVAVDWPAVLAVAEDNARAAGVADRYRTVPGSAFDVDYGHGYDLVLLANFLHHFDPPTCEGLLAKVWAALAEGGRAVSVEFVPNEDRVSPALPAAFSLVMLCCTPTGDTHTFAELDRMFRRAGFARSELHALPPSPEHAIISHR